MVSEKPIIELKQRENDLPRVPLNSLSRPDAFRVNTKHYRGPRGMFIFQTPGVLVLVPMVAQTPNAATRVLNE